MSLMWLVHMTCGLSCWVITLPVTIQISVHSHSSENFPQPLAKTLHIIYQNNTKVSFDVSCPSPSQAPSSFHCIWKQFIIPKPPPLTHSSLQSQASHHPLRPSPPPLLFKNPQGVTDQLSPAASKSVPAFLWHFFMSTIWGHVKSWMTLQGR